MIDPEHLRPGPNQPPKPSILTEEQVKSLLTANIVAAIKTTEETAGFAESLWTRTTSLDLFEMIARKKRSPVFSDDIAVGLFETGRLQEIAFQVMSQYGFDAKRSKPMYTSGGFNSQGSSPCNDGTSEQLLIFPSQTIPGLSFIRDLDFYTEIDTPINVKWSVEGTKRPFRDRLRRLFEQIKGHKLGSNPAAS